MPSSTTRQQNFMRAELGRLRAGEETETGMSEEQLHDFAKGPVKKKKKKQPSMSYDSMRTVMTNRMHKKGMRR